MSAAITARGLVKSYPGMSHPALDHVSLEVGVGEMLAITGPSGSGKSTALYALAGLITLEAGEVEVLGQIPKSRPEWARVRAQSLGLVFQEDWLLPTLTAEQNVELPMMGVEPSATRRRERARVALAQVGLEAHLDRLPAGLSGGERARVAIARALANDPRVILADEPTGELDSENSAAVVALLSKLNQSGTAVVIVTHDPNVAAACHRELSIVDGRIVEAAP